MKKFIKNNLKIFLTIIITAIIIGSVSVYAASQYFARDISFTPTNENFKKENGETINNVEDALNTLYNNKFDLTKLSIVAFNSSSSPNGEQIISSVSIDIPNDYSSKYSIVVVGRSSYWWDKQYANKFSGEYTSYSTIFENNVGVNSGSGSKLQAGNAIGVYLFENLKAGSKLTVSGLHDNDPQTQIMLIS